VKLWLLTQEENEGYDTFDGCVVAAIDEKSAKEFHPDFYDSWSSKPENVRAKLLWDAYDGESGIILASFNAG